MDQKTVRITGEIQKGLGVASRTCLINQIKYFKEYIPDIEKYYNGTINLWLERPLIIFSPDIKTKPIEWINGFVEEFGFLRIKFETIPPTKDMPLDAWIYIPYGSPHYPNPFYKEILAPKINLDSIKYCKITITKNLNKLQIL